MKKAVRFQVEGRVQGVGFRYSAQQKASSLKLNGWVRNEDNGTVALHVEGDDEKINDFEKWLKIGPPGTRVDAVKKRDAQVFGDMNGFKIEY